MEGGREGREKERGRERECGAINWPEGGREKGGEHVGESTGQLVQKTENL